MSGSRKSLAQLMNSQLEIFSKLREFTIQTAKKQHKASASEKLARAVCSKNDEGGIICFVRLLTSDCGIDDNIDTAKKLEEQQLSEPFSLIVVINLINSFIYYDDGDTWTLEDCSKFTVYILQRSREEARRRSANLTDVASGGIGRVRTSRSRFTTIYHRFMGLCGPVRTALTMSRQQ